MRHGEPRTLKDWLPSWLGQWRRAVPAGVIALVLLILLVTAPPRRQEAVELAADPGTASTIPTEETTQPPLEDNIVADVPGATGGEATSGPQTTFGTDGRLGAGGGGATYRGVADKSIKVGFTWQQEQCADFFGPAIAAAFGVPAADPELSIRTAIDYFEKFPTVAFENLPDDLAAGVSSSSGYWGRRLRPVFADNGGPSCSDKARATALKLADQDKVFGTLQIPNDGANQYIAPEMAARKLINIGGPGFTRAMYNKWEPYVYDITYSGTDVMDAWSSWACRDLKGKKSIDTGDPTTARKPRVIALVHPDAPLARALAVEVKESFARCGGAFKVVISYPAGLDQQPGAASNAIAQFRTNSVTSVLMMTDPLFASQLTSAASSQGMQPEWLVTSVGFNDIAFVIRHFYEENQRKNILGASHLTSFDRDKWTETNQYKAWKRMRPDREPPGDWNNWFLHISLLYAGILGAGENLTPQSFLGGLNRVCSPCVRTSKKAGYLAFGPGDTTGLDDFTLVRFNPNKEDIYDPPDQYGRRQLGYWDFPEGGLRYYRTIDRPER